MKAILSRRTLGRWESGSTWVQGFPLESHILLFIEKKKSNCIREKKEGLELKESGTYLLRSNFLLFLCQNLPWNLKFFS